MARINGTAPPPVFFTAAGMPPVPVWTRLRQFPDALFDAGFAVGGALAAFHPVACDPHPLGGLLRQRLALTNAAAIARLHGRKEDEAELRDAWYLRRSGDDPGPAGRVLDAWRRLGRSAAADPSKWPQAAGPLIAVGGGTYDEAFAIAEQYAAGNEAAVRAAAATASSVLRILPQDDMLALWLADAVLAIRLCWPSPVPLLATHIRRPDIRAAARSSEDDGWLSACCVAYVQAVTDAVDVYADLCRRAERLSAVAPKLRSKEAGNVIATLLSEDAMAASASAHKSDRSGRRFFDRLISLGAVRELTGRPTFRLYGL